MHAHIELPAAAARSVVVGRRCTGQAAVHLIGVEEAEAGLDDLPQDRAIHRLDAVGLDLLDEPVVVAVAAPDERALRLPLAEQPVGVVDALRHRPVVAERMGACGTHQEGPFADVGDHGRETDGDAAGRRDAHRDLLQRAHAQVRVTRRDRLGERGAVVGPQDHVQGGQSNDDEDESRGDDGGA